MEINNGRSLNPRRNPGSGILVLQRRLLVILTTAALCCLFLAAQTSTGKHPAKTGSGTSGNKSEVARGKYIVEDVAMCGQCHTPRDDQGQMVRSRWLDGAALWLQPSRPTENWPLKAPRIAGNPPATDADMIRLLTTGVWKDNERLRPPMPQFRMSEDDARAVLAYLKSLTPGPE
jgi:mono/diheme cytochrome c family protein